MPQVCRTESMRRPPERARGRPQVPPELPAEPPQFPIMLPESPAQPPRAPPKLPANSLEPPLSHPRYCQWPDRRSCRPESWQFARQARDYGPADFGKSQRPSAHPADSTGKLCVPWPLRI